MIPSTEDAEIAALVQQLGADAHALTPTEFVASDDPELNQPGLYSWWVNAEGARDLTQGLGMPIEPGLIYAGLAGATRARSGKKSTNTLRGRIRGMHLGGRHQFSTFRLTLGSILASAWDLTEIDEGRLTTWMYGRLRVVPVPISDGDMLNDLETKVLSALDPPLNLSKMPKSATRARITQLRKIYGRR
jgi:hypothetical protein